MVLGAFSHTYATLWMHNIDLGLVRIPFISESEERTNLSPCPQ